MNMLKRFMNDLLGIVGYRIVSTKTSVARDISLGRYDWLRKRHISTVIDVGANTGQFASNARRIYPAATIYSFEPLAACFEQLNRQAERLQPMHCFPFALGSTNASENIHVNTESASSSMFTLGDRHKEAFPSARQSREEQVEVRTLDSVSSELQCKPGILIKIDVQGYELEVLKGSERILSETDTLIVETSFSRLYEGQPLFQDIYQFLSDRKFTYAGNFGKIVDPANGEILQEDSVFFRNEVPPSGGAAK
jgi:FkbM family methyltransferase